MGTSRDHVELPWWNGQEGLVHPARVDRLGLNGPTPAQARGPHWRRVSQGLYVPASIERTPRQRILEASARLPVGAAVTGWAALHLMGAPWSDGMRADGTIDPVPVVAPGRRIRPVAGLLLSEEQVTDDELVDVDLISATSAVRAVWFEARRARNLSQAVAWFDVAAAADLVSLAEAREYGHRLSGTTGVGQARLALAFASENCWSRTETTLRLALNLDGGLAGLVCNHPIFDRSGDFVATPDVFDPASGIAWEYDGEVHWQQRARDLQRETRLRRIGVETVSMVSADLRDTSELRARTEAALLAASRRPASERAWTIVPPPWWTPTVTVAQRRALSDRQRERLLRWRAA